MKIRIEMLEDEQDEIVIRCRELTPDIIKLQQVLFEQLAKSNQITLYKGDTEYYTDIGRILFFETEGSEVLAHTENDVFETHKKLYELEAVLGSGFARISKSSIVNIRKIYSIRKNVTASSLIEFRDTHKQIYVSRAYYKALKTKLEETR